MPDYQGIGLGTAFLNLIAKLYVNDGYDFSIITSAKNLIKALEKSDKWILSRYSAAKKPTTGKIDIKRKVRTNCKTATFFFND